MPIQTFAFPNYCATVVSVGKDYQVFVLVPNLRFLLSKLGPLAKIKLIILDEKRIFHYKLSKKLSIKGPQKYFYFQNTIVQH